MKRSFSCRVLPLLGAVGLLAGAIGCSGESSPTTADGRTKLKVAYLGLTCEAPMFVAQEKGFYTEEGLDVELVKTDWDGLREGLGTGSFDANHTLIMYLLKPIEQGVDMKITGGIHTGCLRLQVAANSDIKSPAELKGKKIGVATHIGSPPYLFSCRVLAAHGIDPRPESDDVQWIPYPPAELGLAVEKGLVDAVCTSDPIGTILVGKGIVRTIADQATDAPYSEEYCCAAVVSGKLARANPAAAAKVTRAFLKASRWVEENTIAAATLAVEKNYIAASTEINAQAISQLKYMPGVSSCRQSIENAASEMKRAGLLKESTNVDELTKRAWLDLEGVTDEWINQLEVEKIADGGRAPKLSPEGFVALFELNKDCLCCCRCCIE
ncbi:MULTISPECIES: ABC transporter substrate-binding protein [unclassified Schlesneria]|uniref:ABC transporter substrate-binding protein n=1 Tax=Schlesneria TaxID=656899 RepID=UPI0035A0F82D